MIRGYELRRGQRAFFEGDLETAQGLIAAVVEASPSWVQAKLWLGMTWSELGDLSRAQELLEQALQLDDCAVSRLWLGRVLIDHQRYREAGEHLAVVIERGEVNLLVPGYFSLARWCEGEDAAQLEALDWTVPRGAAELRGRWLLELERRFPGGPGSELNVAPAPPRTPLQRFQRHRSLVLLEKARLKKRQGQLEAALELLERADRLWLGQEDVEELRIETLLAVIPERRERLEREPHEVDLRMEIAEALVEVGDAGAAHEVLEPAGEHIASLDSNRLSWKATLAFLLGRISLAKGEYGAAIAQLELANDLWAVEVEPLYYLAISELLTGKRSLARRHFVEVCSMDGELADIRLREYREAVVG